MSEVITGVLKLAFGLVLNKLRIYSAEKLQDGGLTDQKFRGWIVRELDDVKFKIDAISRKDLSMSVSCLQQGIKRLNMYFGELSERGNPLDVKLLNDGKNSQETANAEAGATANLTQTKPARESVTAVADVAALANVIGTLKIESNQIFESAKGSFEEARKKAGEAFHNAALSINERILASKVRIASGLLEKVDDPNVAAIDCLHYLQELHNMPAIQEIFSVHVEGGIKSLFKKDSRAEIVETITMINLILADFISKFTKRRMAVFDWPMIECGKQVVHPIHYEKENVRKMREMEITPPWDILMCKELFRGDFAINSTGDIVGVLGRDNHLKMFNRATFEWQPFRVYPSPSEDICLYNHKSVDTHRSVAIDDNDTVYVVSCQYHLVWGRPTYTNMLLIVYSSDGRLINECPLDFIQEIYSHRITVTKAKKIVIYCGGTVYVCDSNGKLINLFPIQIKPEDEIWGLFSSCDKPADEIIIATGAKSLDQVFADDIQLLYLCTQERKLKRTVKLPQACFTWLYGITFDHVTKNYIVCSRDCENKILQVECISEAGEDRNSLFLDEEYMTDYEHYGHIVSHTNGGVAMMNSFRVLYLQSPMM